VEAVDDEKNENSDNEAEADGTVVVVRPDSAFSCRGCCHRSNWSELEMDRVMLRSEW
jgi:hypothetical protein